MLGGEVFELEQTVIVPSELSAITCGGLDAGEMFEVTSAVTLSARTWSAPRGSGLRLAGSDGRGAATGVVPFCAGTD